MSKRGDRPHEENGPHAGDPGAGRTPEEVRARTGSRHELRDTRSRPLILFMISVLVALGLINLAIGGFGLLLRWENRSRVSSPSPMQIRQPVPPEPRLQSDPVADMEQMNADQKAIYESYGWTDRKSGAVRIPVDQAMKVIAQRGFPPRRHDIPTTAAAGLITSATLATAAAQKGGPVK